MSRTGSRSHQPAFRLSLRCSRRRRLPCRSLPQAGALCNLSANVENMGTIASAGGVAFLIALLKSPSVRVQESAVGAVRNLSVNAENKVTIALRQQSRLSSRCCRHTRSRRRMMPQRRCAV
jgi:hypothetical protein